MSGERWDHNLSGQCWFFQNNPFGNQAQQYPAMLSVLPWVSIPQNTSILFPTAKAMFMKTHKAQFSPAPTIWLHLLPLYIARSLGSPLQPNASLELLEVFQPMTLVAHRASPNLFWVPQSDTSKPFSVCEVGFVFSWELSKDKEWGFK